MTEKKKKKRAPRKNERGPNKAPLKEKKPITVRLDRFLHDRLVAIAHQENCTPTLQATRMLEECLVASD